MRIGDIELITTSREAYEIKEDFKNRPDMEISSEEMRSLFAVICGVPGWGGMDKKTMRTLAAGILVGAEVYRRRAAEKDRSDAEKLKRGFEGMTDADFEPPQEAIK